jgi:hypothetical protein
VKFVAVSTVRDEGAAEVAREALEAADLEVEIKRVSPTAYLGPVSLLEFEIRVHEDRIADAELVLRQLSEEAEAAATREWESHPAEPEPSATSPADSSKPLLKLLPTWAKVVVLILTALAVVGLIALKIFLDNLPSIIGNFD